jgi:hypothetical protein
MNKESWYASKANDMDVVRILVSDDWIVDYDKSRGMYRVSYFEDGHFVDECWFDAYEEKEVDDRVEEIVNFLEALKYYKKLSNCIPKYTTIVPIPSDFITDEEKEIDLLDCIIKYIKELK